MKTVVFSLLLVSSAMLMSCGTSQEVISFWKNPKEAPNRPYKSVFIVALTHDRAARNTVEGDLAAAAISRGLKAVRSTDVFPPNFSQETSPSKKEMLVKIRELQCEGIFVVSLLDVRSEQRYVSGETTYSAGYAPYPHYPHYGGFTGYYNYVYPVAVTPGYYTTDKTYFLEGNLYDVATEEIQWSMQSAAYNPSSLKDFSKTYAQLLMDQLNKK